MTHSPYDEDNEDNNDDDDDYDSDEDDDYDSDDDGLLRNETRKKPKEMEKKLKGKKEEKN